jgi:mutator protein MutT
VDQIPHRGCGFRARFFSRHPGQCRWQAWVVSDAVHRCAAGILVRDSTVLLCHRAPDRAWFPNVWDVPGGHIEVTETSEMALVRELREELGITAVVAGEPFAVVENAEHALHMEIWLVDSWHGTPSNQAPEEHDRIAWVVHEDLHNLALADESYRPLLAKAIETGQH